mmetsp:Transcript_2628/g.3571  ORF Transcript_2628/g.3571 Transcript_2628/m.3571 type:complete len:344 (-) Transcript_2628:54-1085(-)
MSVPNTVARKVVEAFVGRLNQLESSQNHNIYLSECINKAHKEFFVHLDGHDRQDVEKKWYELQTHLYSLGFRKSFQIVSEDIMVKFGPTDIDSVSKRNEKGNHWKNLYPNHPLLVDTVNLMLKFATQESINEQDRKAFVFIEQVMKSFLTIKNQVLSKNCTKTKADLLANIQEVFHELLVSIPTPVAGEFVVDLNNVLKSSRIETLKLAEFAFDNLHEKKSMPSETATKKRVRQPLVSRDSNTDTVQKGAPSNRKRQRRAGASVIDNETMDQSSKKDAEDANKVIPKTNDSPCNDALAKTPTKTKSKLQVIREKELEKLKSRSAKRVKDLTKKGKRGASKKKK